LLVGGDTTYHLADYSSLANRFQTPFRWAYEDLYYSGRTPETRKIYGIPGNHDYYDLLDGFRRQFREPIKADEVSSADPPTNAQLVIPGYKRGQKASYLSIELPWDWWLWGLDTELGAIDDRQQKFFQETWKDGKPPDKLIVATCAPTTVFGKYARWEDKKAAQTFFQLKLPWYFWSGNNSWSKMIDGIRTTLRNEMIEEKANAKIQEIEDFLRPPENKEIIMDDGQCRLDISGDVHLYARYWGPDNETNEYRPAGTHGYRGWSDHYASVVSGIGGAFHHPSYTNVDEVQEQVLYPTRKESLVAVADRIFNPTNIINGGGVWLIGFLIAFVIYFGATVPQSSRQAFEGIKTLIDKTFLDAPEPVKIEPTTFPVASTIPVESDEGTKQDVTTSVQTITPPTNKPTYFWDLTGVKKRQFWLGTALLLISFALVAAGALFGRRMFRAKLNISGNQNDSDIEAEKRLRNRNRQIRLWTFVVGNLILIAFGFDQLRRVQTHLSPFGSSMLMLYSVYLGLAALFFCLEYSEWLFEKAHTDYVTPSDWALVWVVSAFGLIGVAAGLWYFGKYNLPVFVMTDVLFMLVLVLAPLGILAAAYFKGGEMLEKPWDKFLIFWVGIWHIVLQLAIPFLFVRYGSVLLWILAGLVSFAAYFLGKWAMRNENHMGLSLIWVLYGGIMVALPFLIENIQWLNKFLIWQFPDSFSPLTGLMGAVLAGAFGAILSCVWLGWYMAVCFMNFNGHNNEVGGAARIENYKQFIRFRLTKNTLTGYVIAIDDVSCIGQPVLENGSPKVSNNKVVKKDGSYLKPKLIDVFKLSVKGSQGDH
jgi:hypothetical protein